MAIRRAFRQEIDSIFYRRLQANGKSPSVKGSGNVNQLSSKKKGKSKQGNSDSAVAHEGKVQAVQTRNGKKNDHATGNSAGPRPQGSQPHFQGKFKSLECKDCKLCCQSDHSLDACPHFRPSERIVAPNPCPCHIKGLHLQKFCPIKPQCLWPRQVLPP